MEIKILHIFGTFSKSNKKIVETETKSISLTHKYMIALLSWFGTGTSIKSGGVKLVLWAKLPITSLSKNQA